jgi:arylsulfate sulfotransferase
LKITIIGQNNNDIIKEFPDSSTSFSVPVLGLYAESTNHILVTLTDQEGFKNQEGLYITTGPISEYYPGAELIVSEPEAMEDGMILVYLKKYNNGLNNGLRPLACMLDAYGKVRWFYSGDYDAPFKRLKNGNWLIAMPDGAFEMDMLGHRTGNRWKIPHVHHDIVELPNGNFLALSQHENSVEDVVVEIGRESGYVEQEWDFQKILDPSRPKCPYQPDPKDWLHLNGMDYDPIDDAIIVSGRNQSAVVKIAKQTGEIFWILGNHEKWPEEFQKYLLAPVGEDFEWSWGQHAPMLNPDDHSRIILFDNGNERSYDNPLPAMKNYSRGVEYKIDEVRMEISQLWQYGKERGHELFCPYIGDANYLPETNNRLICFGGITRNLNGDASEIFDPETGALIPVKNYTQIIETNYAGRVVFEISFSDKTLSFAGYRSYRANKLSLYPEPQE